jgi:hypothetical protein
VAQPTDPLPFPSPLTPAPPSPKPDQPSTANKNDPLRGFGGWLILLILILVVLLPLSTILNVAATATQVPTIWLTDPLGSAEVAGPTVYWVLIDMAVGVALACCGIYAGIKLLKIKPGAVRTAKTFLIVVFGYNFAEFVLTLVAEHRGNTKMDDAVTAELRNVVFALFWWAYLETSKRVAATYSRTKV